VLGEFFVCITTQAHRVYLAAEL